MSDSDNPTRVLLIGDPGPVQQQITTALGSQAEFQLVELLVSVERLARDVYAAEPDIILVDHQLGEQPTLDMIHELALQFPDVAVVAILPSDDVLSAQQVMLAGVRAFLIQPFTQINLLSTLRRVRELEVNRLKTQAAAPVSAAVALRPLRTLAVFSPRGGVGCTTVAVNLALMLHEETGQRVLLLEGKLFFGHLDVMLNIRTQNTIADLIPHASSLDEGLVHDVVFEHASGFHVLLGPSDIQVAQGIRPDDLYTVFVGLQRWFDIIVIDAGSSLSENTVTLMDAADRILLVATPDMASLHDTSRFIQISRSLAYSPEKLLVILNRAGMPGGVKTNDIETALRHQVFAQIPDDGPRALRSLNRGIPLALQYPRSRASRAMKKLSKTLADLSTAEYASGAAGPAEDSAQRKALLASSQLG